MPNVSVVVTTYNRCQMLSETIASILNQTFQDFELIIVDNMSDDGTEQFIKSIDDCRVRYFKNPNYGIIASNRNYGISKSSGFYIAFCDDDDLWKKNKLELQLNYLNKNPNVAMCYSQAESFLDDKVVSAFTSRRVISGSHFHHLLSGNFIPNSSVVIKKQIFKDIGLLNESPHLREDYEMWLRVSKNYLIHGLTSSLIRYRLHKNNNAGSKFAETKRAIITLKSLVKHLDIPLYLYLPNLLIHYLKLSLYFFRLLK